MKKMISIMGIVLSFMMMFSMVYAHDWDGFNDFTAAPPTTAAQTKVNTILGFVQWIGYAIAIGMLIYVGIKYVMAPANEKADIKSSLVKYVIGAVIIAGAATIAGWIFTLGASK